MCAVCSLTQRADKIKEHQVKSVLWSEDGSSAADESHPGYASLSDPDRSHTDFFRKNGFTRFKLPPNKVIHNPNPGDITAFFGRKQNVANNNNNSKESYETDMQVDVDIHLNMDSAEATEKDVEENDTYVGERLSVNTDVEEEAVNRDCEVEEMANTENFEEEEDNTEVYEEEDADTDLDEEEEGNTGWCPLPCRPPSSTSGRGRKRGANYHLISSARSGWRSLDHWEMLCIS